MNIILMGYGKMGAEIEKIALTRGHNIVLKINSANASSVTTGDLRKADVIIEFSTPHTVMDNIRKCIDARVPVVVGTTGWNDHLPAVKQRVNEAGAALFHASNFSVGVNLFFRINRQLAELMDRYPEYDVSMEEIHHVHKLDKPSGTAITLATQILSGMKRKTRWSITEKGDDVLHIHDVREGEVPGTHIIRYQSAVDDIEIMHKAHNRRGFAHGAVVAAEFLAGKTGVFTMDDII